MRLPILLLTVCILLGNQTAAQGSIEPIKEYIEQTEIKYSIPQNLLYAIIEQESSFQIKARLGDSHGLGQLRLGTARAFCNVQNKAQLYDYRINIECAATYVRYQLDRFDNNTRLAISAYNAGTPFICNGSVFKRDLGYKIERLSTPCSKKGIVHNGNYVLGVMAKWRLKNKEESEA